jgi:hypothetical protein
MAQNLPTIDKIFDDLDKFRDFCRFENRGYPFDEKDLYNNEAWVWGAYQKHQNYLRAKARGGNKPFENRRPRNSGDRPQFNNNARFNTNGNT